MLKVLLVGNGYAFILYWLYSHPSKIVKSKFPLCIIKKPRNMSERNERQMESDKPHSQTMVPEVLFYQNYVILQELSNFMSYHKVFILK